MSVKRRWAATGIIVAFVVLLFGYWAFDEEEPHGPPAPPKSKSCRAIEFTCNGYDLLHEAIVMKKGEALVVKGSCQWDQQSSIDLDRVVLILNVVNSREVTFQSAAMETTLEGRTVSFSCTSTAPSEPGSYCIRLEAAVPGTKISETACEGQLSVE
jgi:hypothetical protein